MTPAELKSIRKALGLTQSQLAALLELSPKNGDRSVRVWEAEGATIPGPVAVAVRYIAAERGVTYTLPHTNLAEAKNGGAK